MAWTQTKRHIQHSSSDADLNRSLISHAELCESLLGAPLPPSVWQSAKLMPSPHSYPAPYHHGTDTQSYQQRQQSLYCGYRYCLTLLNENAILPTHNWLGQPITLHWHTNDPNRPTQQRHGIITEVIALGSNQGMAVYQIICEPALTQLRLSSHNRRHHHLSLAELIEDIIAPYNDININMDDQLKHHHIQHSVQYNQTDLAYLQHQLALYGITGYYQHSQDSHTLILLPHDSPKLVPDPADIHSTLNQNPATLADTQDRIISLTPHLAHHPSAAVLYRYDNRATAHHSGTANSQQPTNPSSNHSRFIHSHTRMDDTALNQLATRYQAQQQQHACTGALTGNLRHLTLPDQYRIEGNPYITDPINLIAIHHQIDNHLPLDWLGAAPLDPITLRPKQSPTNEHVHHVHALYQPYPQPQHIPYAHEVAQLGRAHPSLTGLMSASIIAQDKQSISTHLE